MSAFTLNQRERLRHALRTYATVQRSKRSPIWQALWYLFVTFAPEALGLCLLASLFAYIAFGFLTGL